MKLSQAGRSNEVKGLYALCPYIAGIWPLPENPSSTENNGIMLDLHNDHGAVVYGIEDWEKRNPLAWPGFAQEEDVKDLPKKTQDLIVEAFGKEAEQAGTPLEFGKGRKFGITKKEYLECEDKFRNLEIWLKKNNNWRLINELK